MLWILDLNVLHLPQGIPQVKPLRFNGISLAPGTAAGWARLCRGSSTRRTRPDAAVGPPGLPRHSSPLRAAGLSPGSSGDLTSSALQGDPHALKGPRFPQHFRRVLLPSAPAALGTSGVPVPSAPAVLGTQGSPGPSGVPAPLTGSRCPQRLR